jgi:hypothetical protein
MLEIFALTAAESVLNTVKEMVLRNGGFSLQTHKLSVFDKLENDMMFCMEDVHSIVFIANQEQFDKMVVDCDKLLEEGRA